MSARSTVMDAAIAQDTGSEVARNGRLPAAWLHDPLEAMTRPRGPYTLENADVYLDQESVELYNGWLVWQEMTDLKERTVVSTIHSMLDLSARKAGFGQAVADQAECLLRDGHVIKPDASLISWQRLQTASAPQGPNDRILLLVCPELVIESRSPSNRRRQEAMKRAQYFANGTQIVWDVDEKNETIYVYHASAPTKPIRYSKDDEIPCELLPNWHRRVADIFADHLSAEAVAGEVADSWRKEGITIGEARGIEIGEARGIEIGEARGIEIGEARGIRQGLLAAIELGLELKFGATGLQLLPLIQEVEQLEVLRALSTDIKTAQTVDELRALYEMLTTESQ
ncbi:MAG: Uma2 family endonuclease [Caldilineaceae bacterium]